MLGKVVIDQMTDNQNITKCNIEADHQLETLVITTKEGPETESKL